MKQEWNGAPGTGECLELTKATDGIAKARQTWSSPEALFRARHEALIRTLALIGPSKQAAEDAVQEAFIQLCLNWTRVKAYENQEAWVRRVALNRLRNQERSLIRRAQALLRLQGRRREVDLTPDDPFHLPDEILAALRSLPHRQREALVLHYVADLPQSEVARSMAISKGAVNRHIGRGLEALRQKPEVKS